MTKTNENIPKGGDERYFARDTAKIKSSITADDGTSIDLTNADVAFALSNYPGADPIITKSNDGSDVVITDATNGEVEITLHPEDTDGLGSGSGTDYHYEIVVRDAVGEVATVTVGTWKIYADTATFV